jgi:hypothetical protein
MRMRVAVRVIVVVMVVVVVVGRIGVHGGFQVQAGRSQ